MEAITVKELLAAVHGELLQGEGTTKILGVNTDSRTVKDRKSTRLNSSHSSQSRMPSSA